MVEVLESDKPKMKHMAKLLLENLGDDAADLEFVQQEILHEKWEPFRKMKKEGFNPDVIARVTGLTVSEIMVLTD